jgi:arsenate reductase-like glutaredoxin family protein
MSCKKAQGFLEQGDWQPAEQVDASKDRRSRDQALALARAADKVVVGKGKKVVTFDMRKAPPDDDTLATALLGPTGNLKAPTLRKGKTLLVGFSEEAYRQVLGS